MRASDRVIDSYFAIWLDYTGLVEPTCGTSFQDRLMHIEAGVDFGPQIPKSIEYTRPEDLQRIQAIRDAMGRLYSYNRTLAAVVYVAYFVRGRDDNGSLINNGQRAELLGLKEPCYLNYLRRGKDFLLGSVW